MELIKPKEITLASNVGGEEVSKEFRLGRYPATEGLFIFGMAIEVLGSAATPHKSDIVPARKMQELAIEICKYVEAKMPSGDYIRLNQKMLIDAHVPDYEMLFQLVRGAHDWNSGFFSTDRLLKTSLSVIDKAKLLITKTLTQFSQSSSGKKSPASKS
jgi:hypothetical protein